MSCFRMPTYLSVVEKSTNTTPEGGASVAAPARAVEQPSNKTDRDEPAAAVNMSAPVVPVAVAAPAPATPGDHPAPGAPGAPRKQPYRVAPDGRIFHPDCFSNRENPATLAALMPTNAPAAPVAAPTGGAGAGGAAAAPAAAPADAPADALAGSGGGNGGEAGAAELSVKHGNFTCYFFWGNDAGAQTSNVLPDGSFRDKEPLRAQIAALAAKGVRVLVAAGATGRAPADQPADGDDLRGPYELAKIMAAACAANGMTFVNPPRVKAGHPTYIPTEPAPEGGRKALDVGTKKVAGTNGATVPADFRATGQAQLIKQAAAYRPGDAIPINGPYQAAFAASTGVEIIIPTGELRALKKVDPATYEVAMAILRATADSTHLAGVPIELADYVQEAVDGARGMIQDPTFARVIYTVFGGVIPERFAVAAVGAGSTQLCVVSCDNPEAVAEQARAELAAIAAAKAAAAAAPSESA